VRGGKKMSTGGWLISAILREINHLGARAGGKMAASFLFKHCHLSGVGFHEGENSMQSKSLL